MSEKRHARKMRNERVNIVRGTELSCCDQISAVFVFEDRGSWIIRYGLNCGASPVPSQWGTSEISKNMRNSELYANQTQKTIRRPRFSHMILMCAYKTFKLDILGRIKLFWSNAKWDEDSKRTWPQGPESHGCDNDGKFICWQPSCCFIRLQFFGVRKRSVMVWKGQADEPFDRFWIMSRRNSQREPTQRSRSTYTLRVGERKTEQNRMKDSSAENIKQTIISGSRPARSKLRSHRLRIPAFTRFSSHAWTHRVFLTMASMIVNLRIYVQIILQNTEKLRKGSWRNYLHKKKNPTKQEVRKLSSFYLFGQHCKKVMFFLTILCLVFQYKRLNIFNSRYIYSRSKTE